MIAPQSLEVRILRVPGFLGGVVKALEKQQALKSNWFLNQIEGNFKHFEALKYLVISHLRWLLFEGDVCVVVDHPLLLSPARQLDAGRSQLPPLLQSSQPTRLLQLLFAGLALRLEKYENLN